MRKVVESTPILMLTGEPKASLEARRKVERGPSSAPDLAQSSRFRPARNRFQFRT